MIKRPRRLKGRAFLVCHKTCVPFVPSMSDSRPLSFGPVKDVQRELLCAAAMLIRRAFDLLNSQFEPRIFRDGLQRTSSSSFLTSEKNKVAERVGTTEASEALSRVLGKKTLRRARRELVLAAATEVVRVYGTDQGRLGVESRKRWQWLLEPKSRILVARLCVARYGDARTDCEHVFN